MTSPGLLHIIYDELFDIVFDNLPRYELYVFKQLSRHTRDLVDSYGSRTSDLSTILLPFFTDDEISQLRRLQAETGTIISGSVALQFFERVVYRDSDLDLYCEVPYGRRIARFLLDSGYTFVPHKNQARTFDAAYDRVESPNAWPVTFDGDPILFMEYNIAGICGVLSFEKHDAKNLDENVSKRTVQLIISKIPVVGAVLQFHSTCVMNIITHRSAISFFPRTTFQDHVMLLADPNRPPQHREPGLRKYRARGWKPFKSTLHALQREAYDGVRRVGDRQCWVVPLPDIAGVPTLSSTEEVDLHCLNTWQIHTTNRFGSEFRWMRFNQIHSINPSRNFLCPADPTQFPVIWRLDEVILQFQVAHALQISRQQSEEERSDTEQRMAEAWLNILVEYVP